MKNVLVVDDEISLREEMAESLELEDFGVRTADSVQSALEIMETESFDVVVTDLKMPKRGGLDFIRDLGALNFGGMIIVASGHGAESSREEAIENGAVACLGKPIDIDELVSVINKNNID